jgi:hypothetical protein
LNKCFIKTAREHDDPGKGSYWSIADGFEDQATSIKLKSGKRVLRMNRPRPRMNPMSDDVKPIIRPPGPPSGPAPPDGFDGCVGGVMADMYRQHKGKSKGGSGSGDPFLAGGSPNSVARPSGQGGGVHIHQFRQFASPIPARLRHGGGQFGMAATPPGKMQFELGGTGLSPSNGRYGGDLHDVLAPGFAGSDSHGEAHTPLDANMFNRMSLHPHQHQHQLQVQMQMQHQHYQQLHQQYQHPPGYPQPQSQQRPLGLGSPMLRLSPVRTPGRLARTGLTPSSGESSGLTPLGLGPGSTPVRDMPWGVVPMNALDTPKGMKFSYSRGDSIFSPSADMAHGISM